MILDAQIWRDEENLTPSQSTGCRFGATVFVPAGFLWTPPPLHEAPYSCSKMAACFCASVWCQRAKAREEIYAPADTQRLGLERELQHLGTLSLTGSFNQGLSQGSAASRLRSPAILRERKRQSRRRGRNKEEYERGRIGNAGRRRRWGRGREIGNEGPIVSGTVLGTVRGRQHAE